MVTFAPDIGWPSSPTTNPETWLVVSCATASGAANVAAKPAPRAIAGAERIEDTAPARRTGRRRSGMDAAPIGFIDATVNGVARSKLTAGMLQPAAGGWRHEA